MKNKTKCIVCLKKTDRFKINLPVFEHHNFFTTSLKAELNKCYSCHMIFRDNKINYNFFKSRNYKSKNNDNKLISKDNIVTSRSSVLSQILDEEIKSKSNLNVLEIGCGKGYLLNNLSKIFKKSNFFGHDIGDYSKYKTFLKKKISFIKNKKFNFKNESLDIIIVSHTLNYFVNPLREIKKYKKFLKKNGYLMIVTPDIKKNVFYTLMSDQKIITTKYNLTNLLLLCGFSVSFKNHENLTRELICISRPSFKKKTVLNKKDLTLESNLKKLYLIKKKLLKIKTNELSVIGTNINAAFVDEVLGRKIKRFVNDFIIKKENFRGKKIIHKKKLKINEVLINCISRRGNFLKTNNNNKIINIF